MNQPLRSLHPAETPALFSVEEFLEIAASGVFDDADKVELVEGVIVRMPRPMPKHMAYQRRLTYLLNDTYSSANSARIVQPELSLKLAPQTLRAADIGVLDEFADSVDFVDVATVLLVVEIAHTTRERDLGGKREDYARAVMPHYWVVDVEARFTHVMSQPLDGDYAERRPVAFGEPLAVPETDRTIVID